MLSDEQKYAMKMSALFGLILGVALFVPFYLYTGNVLVVAIIPVMLLIATAQAYLLPNYANMFKPTKKSK